MVGPETFEKMDELRGWYSVDTPAAEIAEGFEGDQSAEEYETRKGRKGAKAAIAAAAAPVDDRAALLQKLVDIAQARSRRARSRRKQLRGAGARLSTRDRFRPLGPGPGARLSPTGLFANGSIIFPKFGARWAGSNEEVEAKSPKTASAFEYIDWARRFDQEILPPTAEPEAGDDRGL